MQEAYKSIDQFLNQLGKQLCLNYNDSVSSVPSKSFNYTMKNYAIQCTTLAALIIAIKTNS